MTALDKCKGFDHIFGCNIRSTTNGSDVVIVINFLVEGVSL